MRLAVEIVAILFLTVCVGASSVAFAAPRLGRSAVPPFAGPAGPSSTPIIVATSRWWIGEDSNGGKSFSA